MYATSDENKFLEVTYAKGEREIFYFKDFSSGAMIENIVERAKKKAVKRLIEDQERGIRLDDLHRRGPRGVQGERGSPEHHESRRLGAHLGPQGRADHQRPHADHRDQPQRERSIENIRSGQYL